MTVVILYTQNDIFKKLYLKALVYIYINPKYNIYILENLRILT